MKDLIQKREAILTEADAIVEAAQTEQRGLTADERTAHGSKLEEARALRDLMDTRAANDAERTAALPETKPVALDDKKEDRGGLTINVASDKNHYNERSTTSWFEDRARAELLNDRSAAARLTEHAQYEGATKRDLYIGSGVGSELAPPAYLNDMFVEAKVAGAVAAGLCNNVSLNGFEGQSVTIPMQTGSAGVGVQADANPLNNLTEANAAFSTHTESIVATGGVQDLSGILTRRSFPGADMIIMGNLAKGVAADTDRIVLHGSGSGEPQGIRGATGIQAVTYTDASPTFAEAQASIADAVQQIHSEWLAPATGIVMHPRRWAKFMSERDGDGRPLGASGAYAVNPLAVGQLGGGTEGLAGYIHGIPVYLDANIVTTSGSGTNEDTIFIADWSQALLFTDTLRVEIDRSVNFKADGVAVRAVQDVTFLCEHAPDAFGTVSGTGLVAPTFA